MEKKNEKKTTAYRCCSFFLFHFPLLSNIESSNNNTTTSQSTINNNNNNHINSIERISYYRRDEKLQQHYIAHTKAHFTQNTRRTLFKHLKHNQCNEFAFIMIFKRWCKIAMRHLRWSNQSIQLNTNTLTRNVTCKQKQRCDVELAGRLICVLRSKQLGFVDK